MRTRCWRRMDAFGGRCRQWAAEEASRRRVYRILHSWSNRCDTNRSLGQLAHGYEQFQRRVDTLTEATPRAVALEQESRASSSYERAPPRAAWAGARVERWTTSGPSGLRRPGRRRKAASSGRGRAVAYRDFGLLRVRPLSLSSRAASLVAVVMIFDVLRALVLQLLPRRAHDALSSEFIRAAWASRPASCCDGGRSARKATCATRIGRGAARGTSEARAHALALRGPGGARSPVARRRPSARERHGDHVTGQRACRATPGLGGHAELRGRRAERQPRKKPKSRRGVCDAGGERGGASARRPFRRFAVRTEPRAPQNGRSR